MKLLVIIAALLVGALAYNAAEAQYSWEEFRANYAKVYDSAETAQLRFEVFKNNLAKVEQHNAAPHTFTMGMKTPFADLTHEEFAAWLHLCKLDVAAPGTKAPSTPVPLLVDAPAAVDWNAAGAVTPVKNQASCGGCWAFSATGAVEGAWEISQGQLISLSEEQLIDCDTSDSGCGGGLPSAAFGWITSNGGISTEAAYPYTAGSGSAGSCESGQSASATVSSHTEQYSVSVATLEGLVASGPVSVAVEADQDAFQFYTSGVVTSGCGTNLDHAVLAVGYQTNAATPYWVIKNSWGTGWGQSGFIWIGQSDAHNYCGVLSDVSQPVCP